MGKATVDRAGILDALPGTRAEVMRKTNVLEGSVARHLKALHGEGKCFIGGWKDGRRGLLQAVYYPGKGKDMAQPARQPRQSATESGMRWRTKSRATGGWEAQLQKRRERHAAKRQQLLLWAAPLFALNTPPQPYY